MAVSSQDVIRTVSKKLKYYMEVKRLEDGFDLSGVDCPKLDHPPTKARSTLQYDGLHDRPLKHYFSPKNVKQILTQFKTPLGRTAREKEIRKQLEHYLQRHQYTENGARKEKAAKSRERSLSTQSLHTEPKAPRRARGRRAASAKANLGGPQPSPLSDGYYNHTKSSKKLKPEASGGFGVGLKKRKSPHRGGSAHVLRSVPSNTIGRQETERLMNLASRLLATTEMIDVNKPPVRAESKSISELKPRGAPRPFETQRRRHKIYTYDIHGRRLLVKGKSESEEDSAYNSPSPNYLTINGEHVDDQVMPVWLREEMDRASRDPYSSPRPHSSYSSPGGPRPYSANTTPHPPSNTRSNIRPRPKAGWDSEHEKDSRKSEPRSQTGTSDKNSRPQTESSVQTGGELLKKYDPMEQIIYDGERTEYEVRVRTGSGLGASTKADIKIALVGDRGRTEDIYLEDSTTHKVKFQKGQEDIFKLKSFTVGMLRKIAIGHDRQELGYGWYLSKVVVIDLKRMIQYVIPCERWLSARGEDQRTFREFPVDHSTTFTFSPPPPEESAPEPDPTPRPPASSRDVDERSEATSRTSRTSVATIYSDRSDRSSRARTPTYRSTRSPSTSSYTSTSSYRKPLKVDGPAVDDLETEIIPVERSSDEESTARLSDRTNEEKKDKEAEEEKPVQRPPPDRRQLQRKDTFFDQKQVGPDYGSVIDTISYTTEQDTAERQDLLDKNNPDYVAKNPLGKELTLKEEDEETGVLSREDVADEETTREEEKMGKRLSMPDPPLPPANDQAKPKELKTGIDAVGGPHTGGSRREQVSVNSSTHTSDSDSSTSTSDSMRISNGPTIHEAAGQGDLQRLKKILQHFPHKKDEVDERGWAPIHIVSSAGDTESVKWLAVCKADLNKETPIGYTPIHMAAMNGHTDTMMVLNAMGAKLDSKSIDHQTALHLAVLSGHLETVKWLVANRAPTDEGDNLGRTPLDLAEQYKHNEVAEFLKSCQQDQGRPETSRSTSRQRKRLTRSERDRRAKSTEDRSNSHTSDSSDTDSDLSNEDPAWTNNTRLSARKEAPRSAKSVKHDEELMEKKHMYEEQQRRLSEKNVSFLDYVRNEAL